MARTTQVQTTSASQTSPRPATTRRQREVLDYLTERSARSSESASMTYGTDHGVAEKLVELGVLNKRYDAERGLVYWIRAEGEPATGTSVPVGFVVILGRDVTTPGGRGENFFLARASYDARTVTLRRLLRGWLRELGLRPADLSGGTWGIELVLADAPVFDGDHVILETTTLPDGELRHEIRRGSRRGQEPQ